MYSLIRSPREPVSSEARCGVLNRNVFAMNPTRRSFGSQTGQFSVNLSTELTRKPISNIEKPISDIERLLHEKARSNSPSPDTIQGNSSNRSPSNKEWELLEERLWPEMKEAEEMSPPQLNDMSLSGSTIRSQYVPANGSTEFSREHISNPKRLEKTLSNSPYPDTVQGDSSNVSPEIKGRGIVKALGLCPKKKAGKEMPPDSPRQLYLKRLLSKSGMGSSQRNTLPEWREFHGSNNWDGISDRLHPDLRRELMRDGKFVQRSYKGFDSAPATSSTEPPTDPVLELPDKFYEVTKCLYATSPIGLAKLVNYMAPNRMTQRTSFIGYVAVCTDETEIKRMGRRDIVIVLRGTVTLVEWLENLRDVLVSIPGEEDGKKNGGPKVECGFLSLYKTQGAHVPSLSETVVKEIQRLLELYKTETLTITITGHSLGAALALLVANDVSTCAPHMPPVAVVSFGGPRVGNQAFLDRLNTNNVKVLRIVISKDWITKVPGLFFNEKIVRKLRNFGLSDRILDVLKKGRWSYMHVGTELKLKSKKSPYLKLKLSLAVAHNMEVYLHLLDGFEGSNLSFRENAKRSLATLHAEHPNAIRLNKGRAYKKLKSERASGLQSCS